MSPNVPPEKDTTLALVLAAGAGVTAAAEQCRMSRKTVQRKLRHSGFRSLVADLRNELFTRALGRLADNMTRAAETVAAILDSDDARVRLRAARTLLSLGLRLRDSVELTDRVREIEQELAAKQGISP